MRLKIITIILLLTINNLLGKSDNNIKIFTEHYPPYNMMIDGKLTGSSVEILGVMFKQMKLKQRLEDIQMTNWARGYSLVQKVENTMLFSTTRTEEREQLFKWVGPIDKSTIGIIAPKRKNIKINKISDLHKYKFGAVLKGVGELLLLSNGVSKDNIVHAKGENVINILYKAMEDGTIDMFSYNTDIAFANTKSFDMDKYEIVYVLKKSELYFAFNKGINDIIINKWQKALDEIKDNGLYAKIIKRY